MSESEENSSGGPSRQRKLRAVRSRAPSKCAVSYLIVPIGHCFTTVTPDGQPPFEIRLSTTALPDMADDMRQQEETSHPGVPVAWTNTFIFETTTQPAWKSFWEFAFPRVLVLKSTKMYLANEQCFQEMLASFLASALSFAATQALVEQ